MLFKAIGKWKWIRRKRGRVTLLRGCHFLFSSVHLAQRPKSWEPKQQRNSNRKSCSSVRALQFTTLKGGVTSVRHSVISERLYFPQRNNLRATTEKTSKFLSRWSDYLNYLSHLSLLDVGDINFIKRHLVGFIINCEVLVHLFASICCIVGQFSKMLL